MTMVRRWLDDGGDDRGEARGGNGGDDGGEASGGTVATTGDGEASSGGGRPAMIRQRGKRKGGQRRWNLARGRQG